MEEPHHRLEEARRSRGYETPTDAARAMGVPPPTYLGHENGNNPISKAAAIRYASFFRISLTWLLTGRGSMNGASPVEEAFERIPEERREEALRYLEFLAEQGESAPRPGKR